MASKKANFADNEGSELPCSLPRLITPAVQCSFCAYMWELYTTEFGWSMADYGTVSRTCTGAQIVSFIGLGLIASFAIDQAHNQAAAENKTTIQTKKLPWTKGVEVAGTFIHWITYFFLIILPIKWHGVKTPYVDSMLGNTLRVWTPDFWRPIFKGPVPLSSMATSRFWWVIFGFPWCFVKFFWVILYIPMKVCFLCIVNFGAILWIICYPIRRFRKDKTIPILSTFESITLAKGNNFAMRMRHTKQWMRTRTFRIYFLVFAHGVGVSMHELCNKALYTYIYPEKRRGNELKLNGTPLNTIDVNQDNRGTLTTINLTFFFIAQLLIVFLFSIIKFFVRSRAFFAETFFLASILFLLMQPPILIYFCKKTEYKFNDQADTTIKGGGSTGPSIYNDANGGTVDNAARTGINADANPTAVEGSGGNVEWVKVFCLTFMHGTILFWMFSGGPLTNYIANAVLGGHIGIGSFGVLIFNVSLTVTSWIFTIIAMIGGAGFLFNPYTQKSIAIMCVVCEFLIYYVFNAHDYLILIITGMANSLYVTYVNIMFDGVVKTKEIKKFRWLANGLFFGITNLILTPTMDTMFKSLGQDEIKHIAWRCIRFGYHYCFPTVYKTITIVFILLDAVAFIPVLVI